MQFVFLPPKEPQGKVRQSQGRATANNFAFSKTDFRVHRDPPLTTQVLKGFYGGIYLLQSEKDLVYRLK